MEEIIVKSQAELDALPTDYNGRIYIEFGTPYNRAVVKRRFKYSVVAWENSSVEAWENSSVEARENSSVVARGNSSVVARGNSSVEARGNAQVVDETRNGDVSVSGNARIVYNPRNINEYLKHHGIEETNGKVRLFKAVHKRNNEYVSDHNGEFTYTIGEEAQADNLDTNNLEDCGHGIHMAYKEWCVDYGREWKDLAILEVEAEVSGIVVPLGGCEKVRAEKVLVLREVPLEECGLLGKILAKRMKEKK